MTLPAFVRERSALLPYYRYRAAAALARSVPEPVARAGAYAIGVALAAALGDRRAIVRRHLRRVLGTGVSEQELDRLVRNTFTSYARYWMESCRLPGTVGPWVDERMSSTGVEQFDKAKAEGKGVILALPHLGGWDHGGAWLGWLGHPLTAVVEPVEPPELFRWIAELRRAVGMDIVPLGPGAGTTLLKRLRDGAIVALVCDRDIGGGGVEVEFFGERTTLPAGPATLALRTGSYLLPTAVYFEGPKGHYSLVGQPLPAERTGRLRDDVTRVTQDLAHALEELIRRAPDQWHMMQPNWPSDQF
ncbi:MAG TPA: phosphatidylinositol mannoside acyltransferase [Acidimicrobiales bacterium]|nr:phosphatidylinositol mannoside acyltransferase [Acidimicrobiales bacterium]